MKQRMIASAAVACMLLATAACGDDDDSAEVENVSSAQGGGDPDNGGEGPDSGGGGPVDANVGEDVLATATTDIERGISRDGTVPLRADVMRLARNGDLVDLVIVLTNEDDIEDYKPHMSRWSDGPSGNRVDEIRLVDQGAQRVYLAAEDSGGDCLCSTGAIEIGPGESLSIYLTYGGIPADVNQVDIHLPYYAPMNGVPISG